MTRCYDTKIFDSAIPLFLQILQMPRVIHKLDGKEDYVCLVLCTKCRSIMLCDKEEIEIDKHTVLNTISCPVCEETQPVVVAYNNMPPVRPKLVNTLSNTCYGC